MAGRSPCASGSTMTRCRTGPATVRAAHAVRAVIRRDDHAADGALPRSLATTSSPVVASNRGSPRTQALIREVSEECGRTVTRGRRRDRAGRRAQACTRTRARSSEMESTYHPCDVDDEVHAQRLDDYERELGVRARLDHPRRGDRGQRARPGRGQCPDLGPARDPSPGRPAGSVLTGLTPTGAPPRRSTASAAARPESSALQRPPPPRAAAGTGSPPSSRPRRWPPRRHLPRVPRGPPG